MIVEEKKADEKVCCGPNIEVGIGCAGSRCMAWRWKFDNVIKKTDDPDAPSLEWVETVQSTTHGFCGLAGRP